VVKKAASTTRVFELARELGVSSKDVIEKCQREEIPNITNHMSAVGLGLAATIREWFTVSGGGTATAIESTAPVDLERAREAARKATRRKAVKKAAPSDGEEQLAEPAPTVETSVALVTPEGAAPAAAAPETPRPMTVAPADEKPVDAEDGGPVAPPRTVPSIAAAAAASEPVASSTAPTINVPVRPRVVRPAGPQLQQPKKTTLAGPKVIRIEKAEPVPPPRRVGRDGGSSGVGARTGRGAGTPLMPDLPANAPGRDARSSRRNKRRTATATGREGGRSARSAPAESDRPFNWREQDLLERERRINRAAGFIRQARRDSQKRASPAGIRAMSAAETGGRVRVEPPLTIKNLSSASGVRVNDIVRKLVQAGKAVTNTEAVLDPALAMEIMATYDIELEIAEQRSAEQQIADEFEDREIVDERPRSPVVTILGHVDHGKTTLLDQIRKTNVAAGEAGGITQATSAFRVPVKVGGEERFVTFIDTPGHEAFTEMRSRGARVTDIVVLVVAADDGVMPQTVESINHAKAAGVPIIVALNKIDKPEATDNNIQRILGQLAEHELNPVEWGGQTEVVRVSALKGKGIQDLLDILDYQAQLRELKADFGGPAAGTVLEAQMEEGRGAVARLLVQQGRLAKGDFIVAGRAFGRVRDILDDRGRRVDSAEPSTPVAISGIDEVPDAGDRFYVVKTLKAAEASAGERKSQERERGLAREKVTLDNIFDKLSEAGRKELPLVVKADVQGSLETLRVVLGRIGSDEVRVVVKHAAVGGVNESDVALAEACGAIIVAFNVTAPGAVRRAAEDRGVDVRFYDVIYDLTDDVTKAAEGLLAPEVKLEILGHAEVREVFKISKVGMVAGCYVTSGTIERDAQVRVTRGDIVVEKDRRLKQLKRFKDDARTVTAGQECGMLIDGYDDIKVGDVLECYRTREIRRSLGG
jgi:translation initiation factor IF-2